MSDYFNRENELHAPSRNVITSLKGTTIKAQLEKLNRPKKLSHKPGPVKTRNIGPVPYIPYEYKCGPVFGKKLEEE